MSWGQTRTLEQIRQRLTEKQVSLDVETKSPYQQLVIDFNNQRERQADDLKRRDNAVKIWKEFDYRLEMFDSRGILRDVFWSGLGVSNLNPVAKSIVSVCKQIQFAFQDFARNVSNSFTRMRVDMRLNFPSAAISLSRFCQSLNPFAAWRRRSQEKQLFAEPEKLLDKIKPRRCKVITGNSPRPAPIVFKYSRVEQEVDGGCAIEFT